MIRELATEQPDSKQLNDFDYWKSMRQKHERFGAFSVRLPDAPAHRLESSSIALKTIELATQRLVWRMSISFMLTNFVV